MTDPNDIDPAAANWLAERLDPAAGSGTVSDVSHGVDGEAPRLICGSVRPSDGLVRFVCNQPEGHEGEHSLVIPLVRDGRSKYTVRWPR